MSKIKHIFWDWHGVIGLTGFWHISSKNNQEIKNFVDFVFNDHELVDSWMKNEYSLDELLSKSQARVSYSQLVDEFKNDIKLSLINHSLLSSIQTIYPGIPHSIVTDNMDIFIDYLKNDKYINSTFCSVYDSSTTKLLKGDTPGLFEHTLTSLRWNSFENTLLFDDSPANCSRFKKLGGKPILVKRNGL